MSILKKLLYLSSLFTPFLIVIAMFYGDLYKDTWVLNDYISSFKFTMLHFTAYGFYIVLYINHARKDERVQEKILWSIGFVFFYWPAMLGYWIKYIRTA